jgi:hypothetical protein
LFNDTDAPAIADVAGNPVSVGVMFQAAYAGTITGLRFYKGPQNTGSHIGSLWASDGTLLSSGTFTNESASGWQDLILDTPIAVTGGTDYIAAYYSETGFTPATEDYFAVKYENGPLSVAPDGGVYVYTDAWWSGFPTVQSANNFWVDVVFSA